MIRCISGFLSREDCNLVKYRFNEAYVTACDPSYCRNIFDCANDPMLRPLFDGLESELKQYMPESYHMSTGKGAITLIDAPSYKDNQKWHRDGEHDNISVFIPCVDISNNGATQIIPDSEHIPPQYWRSNFKNMIEYQLKAGDVLIFSGRLLHRGMTNHTENRRPVIALTFVPDGGVEYHQELIMQN